MIKAIKNREDHGEEKEQKNYLLPVADSVSKDYSNYSSNTQTLLNEYE
jgi:hypothetical protein